MGARQWLVVGFVLTVLGLATYLRLYFVHVKSFTGLRLRQVFYQLVSHVPDDDRSAGLHILAGVMFTCGVAFVLGGTVVTMPFVTGDADNNSLFLTTAGFVFGVEISILSFWTLWQTRRIEQNQGSDIASFTGLISGLAEDMEQLLGDLKARNFSATSYHRIYLVTTNPFLGELSFPREDSTIRFGNALRNAARWVAESSHGGSTEGLDFQILCGDVQAIGRFHEGFFGTLNQPVKSSDPRVSTATAKVEKGLQDLESEAGKKVVHRLKSVPPVQFAVVGHSVFEFLIDSQGSQSEIQKARRIRERVMCDRFVETFKILKQLP